MHIDDEDNLPAQDDQNPGNAEAEVEEGAEPSQPQDENEESDEGADDGQPEDDDEELDYQGKKFRAPKGVKDAMLMHADYTKKTQTLSDARKQVNDLAARVNADFEAKKAFIEDLAEAKALEKQIDLFKGLNWDAIQHRDMGEYLRLQRQFEAAKTSLTELNGKITQKQHEQSLQAQRETAKQLQEGLQVLKGWFPDWTPQTFVDIGGFAQSMDFTPEEVGSIADPRYMRVLHYAKIGKQFEDSQKRQKPSKPANVQQPELKPVTKVTKNRPGPVPLSDKQNIDDWMKTRQRQVGR